MPASVPDLCRIRAGSVVQQSAALCPEVWPQHEGVLFRAEKLSQRAPLTTKNGDTESNSDAVEGGECNLIFVLFCAAYQHFERFENS